MARNFTGSNCDTAESLLLNAGAFFKNYIADTDTYETAMASGKCLGATQGGGSFTAIPEVRMIEVDGAEPIPTFDAWACTITANIMEIKPETLVIALGSGVIIDHNEKYYNIKAKRYHDSNDFLENITWVGMLSGSNEPVVIQIYNAINTTGLTINVAPKSQSVLAVTFTSKGDTCKRPEDANYAPFSIFYPKSIARITINPVDTNDTTITGTGTTGATVTIKGGTIETPLTSVVSSGTFSFTITAQTLGTTITGFQTVGGRKSLETNVTVTGEIK